MARKFNLIGLSAAAALLMSGCKARFVYDQLDWILPWQASRYVDLSGQDKALLKQVIKDQLLWHRQSQLPQYATTLRDFSRDYSDGLTRAKLENFYSAIQQHWAALPVQLASPAGKLLARLSDSQVEELEKRMRRKNRHFRETRLELEPVERRKLIRKEMQDKLEKWLGNLNKRQEAALDEWANRYRDVEEARLTKHRRWQKEFREALKQRKESGESLNLLVRMLAPSEQDRFWPAASRADVAFNREATLNMILELDRLSEPDQRRHVVELLQGLARDCDRLANSRN